MATQRVVINDNTALGGDLSGFLPNPTVSSSITSGFVAKSGDTMTGDLVGKSFVSTRSGSITRSGDTITSVSLTGGRTLTITRTDGVITSANDGTGTFGEKINNIDNTVSDNQALIIAV